MLSPLSEALWEWNGETVPNSLGIVLEVDSIIFATYSSLGYLQPQKTRLGVVIGCECHIRKRRLKWKGSDFFTCIWELGNPVHRALAVRITACAGNDVRDLLVIQRAGETLVIMDVAGKNEICRSAC